MGECFMFGRGTLEPFDPVFANNSWENIIRACQLGIVPTTWRVGDQKSMDFVYVDSSGVETIYPHMIDIIGTKHDDYADGSGKAPITFQLHNCWSAYYEPNALMWATSANDWGWTECLVRTTTLPLALTTMPTVVQNALREVSKGTTAGCMKTNIVTTSDKLFLLSEVEVFGTKTYTTVEGEGARYAYYTRGGSHYKVLNSSSTTNCNWWLRSPGTTSNSGYCCSAQNNTGCSYAAANSKHYISFAFCF